MQTPVILPIIPGMPYFASPIRFSIPSLQCELFVSLLRSHPFSHQLSRFFFYFVTAKSAKKLHEDLAKATFRATFEFLTTEDASSILNRFSLDMSMATQRVPALVMPTVFRKNLFSLAPQNDVCANKIELNRCGFHFYRHRHHQRRCQLRGAGHPILFDAHSGHSAILSTFFPTATHPGARYFQSLGPTFYRDRSRDRTHSCFPLAGGSDPRAPRQSGSHSATSILLVLHSTVAGRRLGHV